MMKLMLIVMLMLMLMLMLTGQVFADTTFVSGAVLGEWTRDGNPYIVVDSTWVPEGERLTLTGRVKLFFQEGQGLDVFGTFRVNGVDLGNRIEIGVLEGVTDWKGIRFYGRNQTVWEWAEMRTPQKAILLSPRNSITMSNCELFITGRAFRGIDEINQNIENCSLTFNNSQITGGMFWVPVGGTITADHTTIHFDIGDFDEMPGFSGEGTSFRLTNCIIYGGIYNNLGTTIIENSRFLRPGQGAFIFVPVHGEGCRMINTFVDGGSGAYGGISPTIFKNNVILGDCGFSGTNVQVSECDIRGWSSVSGHRITFKNSTLSRAFWTNNADTTIIDSCALIYEHPRFNFFMHDGDDESPDRLIVTRSILKSIWYSMGSGEYNRTALFDHNTFIMDVEENEVLFAPTINNLTSLTNNIIMKNSGRGQLGISLGATEFSYNCVWGFDYASGIFDSAISIEEIDTTNIIENPSLDWFANIPQLSSDSPCIDRGDPNAPLDQDGTRSDIGARYFHQESSVPRDQPVVSNFQLLAYPNPFNSMLTISFMVGALREAPLRLAIYDLSGREVYSAVTALSVTGTRNTPPTPPAIAEGDFRTLVWDASASPAGVYFVNVQAGGEVLTKKVVLMR